MALSTISRSVIRFDVFEVDLQAAELKKNGRKIRLQVQPFRVLAMLLERPGTIVTREEMRQKLWPADTFVDFEHGLNSAVARLRETLNDSAERPRFVETLPRQGYRFIADAEVPQPSEAPIQGPIPKPIHKPRRVWMTILAVALCAGASIGVWRFAPLSRSRVPGPRTMPLAGMPGYELEPVFSPDAKQVAFHEVDGHNSGIYTALVDGEKPLRLTNSPDDCCVAWSPDGKQLAFMHLSEDEVGIYLISALGGTERRVYRGARAIYPSLSWSPDGRVLAFPESDPQTHRSWITFLSLASGATQPLTFPPGTSRDDAAVFSPDGSQVAFRRGTLAGVVNDVFVIPSTGGKVKRLTFDSCPIQGISWTADGQEIVFSSSRAGPFSLWRVSALGGPPRPVEGASLPAFTPSVAPSGKLLAYVQLVARDDIWQIDLVNERTAKGLPFLLISEKGSKLRPHYSPDGKWIAFESDRLGSTELWICRGSGSDCSELTSLHGIVGTSSWSPNGREIAFEFHPGERSQIYLADVTAGTTRLLTTIPEADNLVPSWSRDGKWIYFTSKKGNSPFQLWKVPSRGGSPVQITGTGGLYAIESPDGRFLYYAKYELGGVWRMPLNGGEETEVLDQPSGETWYNWTLGTKGIYFFSRTERHWQPTIDYFELATHKRFHVAELNKPIGWGLALSPDGKSLLYVQAEFEESNIMLVKNF